MHTRVLAVHTSCISIVTVSPYNSDIHTGTGLLHPMQEMFCRATIRVLNNDQSVSLIPETGSPRDPRITNLLIPDPGIEKSIPGLQSLANTSLLLQNLSWMTTTKLTTG